MLPSQLCSFLSPALGKCSSAVSDPPLPTLPSLSSYCAPFMTRERNGPKMAKHGRLVNVPKWSKRVQKGLKWTTYLFLPFGTRLGPSGPFCISAKPYFVHGGPQSKKLGHRQVSYVWPDCGIPKQLLCFQGKWDLCKCGNCDFLMPPIKYSISGNGFSLSGFYLSVIGAVGRSRFRGFCEIFPILLIKL